MKRVEIDSEFARIGIKTQPARVNVERSARRVAQSPPQMQSPPTFKVNWQAIREQTGTAGVVQLSKRFAPAAQADAGTNTSAFSEVSGQYTQEYIADSSNMDVGALVEWDMGTTKINVSPYELNIEWGDTSPEITVEPHSVEIFMENYPSIKISVVEDRLMITQGRNVDKKV